MEKDPSQPTDEELFERLRRDRHEMQPARSLEQNAPNLDAAGDEDDQRDQEN